jgi:hypothetical protein
VGLIPHVSHWVTPIEDPYASCRRVDAHLRLRVAIISYYIFPPHYLFYKYVENSIFLTSLVYSHRRFYQMVSNSVR